MTDKAKQAYYQRQYYERQKAKRRGLGGYVFAVIIDSTGDSFIGITRNSLTKKKHQIRAERWNGVMIPYRHLVKELILLEEVQKEKDLKAARDWWVNKFHPSLNKK